MPSTRQVVAPVQLTGVGTTIEPKPLIMSSGGLNTQDAMDKLPRAGLTGSVAVPVSLEESVFGRHRAPLPAALSIPEKKGNADVLMSTERCEDHEEGENAQEVQYTAALSTGAAGLSELEIDNFDSPVAQWTENDESRDVGSALAPAEGGGTGDSRAGRRSGNSESRESGAQRLPSKTGSRSKSSRSSVRKSPAGFGAARPVGSAAAVERPVARAGGMDTSKEVDGDDAGEGGDMRTLSESMAIAMAEGSSVDAPRTAPGRTEVLQKRQPEADDRSRDNLISGDVGTSGKTTRSSNNLPQLTVGPSGLGETGGDGVMKDIIEEVSVTLFTRRKQNYSFISSITSSSGPTTAAAATAAATAATAGGMQRKMERGARIGDANVNESGDIGSTDPNSAARDPLVKKLHRSVSVLATHTATPSAARFRTPEARLAAFHHSRQKASGPHVHIGPVFTSREEQQRLLLEAPSGAAPATFWPRSGVAGSEPEMTWVKKLIRYVDTKPLFAALTGEGAGATSGADGEDPRPEWVEGGDATEGPRSGGTDIEVLPGEQDGDAHTARVTVFPSRRNKGGGAPDKREDALMLERWLEDMMREMKVPMSQAMTAEVAPSAASRRKRTKRKAAEKKSASEADAIVEPGTPSVSVDDIDVSVKSTVGATALAGGSANADSPRSVHPVGAEPSGLTEDATSASAGCPTDPSNLHSLSESALWLFRCAFEEVRRQVATNCKERAVLLRRLWESYFSLVEVRTSLKYESQIEFMRSRMLSCESETEAAARAHEAVLRVLDERAADHKHIVSMMEHSKAKMIRECRNADKRMKEMEERMACNEKKVLEEVDARCAKEKEVMLLRRELEVASAKMKEMEDTVFRERERAVEAEKRCTELHYLTTEKIATQTSLEEEIESLKAENARLEDEKKGLKDDLGSMRLHVSKLDARLEEEMADSKRKSEELATAATERVRLEAAIEEVNTRVTEQNATIEEQRIAKTQLDLLYTRTKDSLESSDARVKRLEMSLETLHADHERDAAQLKLQRIQLREQLEHCLGNLRAAEVRESALKDQLSVLEPELGTLRSMIKELSEVLEVVDDEGAFADPKAVEEQWRETGSKGKAQRLLRACTSKYGEIAKSRTRAENQKIVLKQHVEGKQKDIDRVEHKLFQEKCRNEKLQRSLDSAEAKVAQLTRDSSVMRTENQQLKDRLADTQEKFELLKQEVRGLRIQGANEERLQKEMHALHDVLQKTKNKLEGERSQRIELTSQNSILSKDLDHMASQCRDLTQSNAGLNAKVKELGTTVFKQANDLEQMRRENEDESKRSARANEHLSKNLKATERDLAKTKELLRDSVEAKKRLDGVFQKTLQALSVSRFVIRGLQSNGGGGQSIQFPQEIEDVFESIIVPKEMLPQVVKLPNSAQRRRSSIAIGSRPEDRAPEVAEVALPDGPVSLVSILSDDPPACLFRVSMAMLAASNRRLRRELVEALQAHEDDLKTLTTQMHALGAEYLEALEMHKEHLRITRSETSLKAEILRAATETLTGLSANQNEICGRLTHWETNFRQRKSVGLQVNDASMMLWLDYVNRLPRSLPAGSGNVSLDRKKVVKLIVQIHLKRLELFSSKHVGSGGRVTTADTIFENIRLTFRQIYGNYENSPAERSMASFLTCCRMYQDDTKIITFAKFAGLTNTNEVLVSESYNFYTECLECLKRLLGVNWRAVVHDWEQGMVVLPLTFVFDLMCNLYNTNDPASLLVFKQKFMPSVQQTASGDGIDLDVLLATLLKEHTSGHTPVQPMLAPRRATSKSGATGHMSSGATAKQPTLTEFEYTFGQ